MASPAADLYWGYDLGDMTDADFESLKPSWLRYTDDEDGDETDWREEYARRLGWKEIPYPDGHPGYDYDIRDTSLRARRQREAEEEFLRSPAYVAWAANRDEMNSLVSALPVELVTYGEDAGSMYCVQVVGSVQSVSDFQSKELVPLVVRPGWRDQVFRFMKFMELPVPEGKEPGWHLNCSYG